MIDFNWVEYVQITQPFRFSHLKNGDKNRTSIRVVVRIKSIHVRHLSQYLFHSKGLNVSYYYFFIKWRCLTSSSQGGGPLTFNFQD